jgi:hydroxymethylpyrimidine pyrophosphatase-like HAD family hydrolase
MKAYTAKDPIRLLLADVDGTLVTQEKVLSDNLNAVAACEVKVREELGSHVSAARSQPYYLDVTHPVANKGGVVEFLSAVYLIPAGSIATIGDMPNDVLMFNKSGMSIAMGNASKEVQEKAHFVTRSNEENGFAFAVEEFVLESSNLTPFKVAG